MASETTIYSRFVATKVNGEKIKLRIQNLAAEKQKELVDLLLSSYVKDDVLMKASGISKSKDALEELKSIYDFSFQKYDTASLVCCTDDEKADIVGFTILYKEKKDDSLDAMLNELKTLELKTMFGAYKTLVASYNVFDKLNIKVFLTGDVYVNADLKKSGVATELLKARKTYCEQMKISVTGAWFMETDSQKAAEEAGYKLLEEIPYTELAEKTGLIFDNEAKTCKLMVLCVNF